MKVKELIETLQNPVVQKFKTETSRTWDRFDGTDYTYTRYVEDKNGPIEAVRLW